MRVPPIPPAPDSERGRDYLVLTVGVDSATLAVLAAAAQVECPGRLESVATLEAARRFVDEVGRPVIAFIERAAMEKSLAFPEFVHVIVLAGPSDPGSSTLGVDEVMARPLRVEELRTRIRIAARAIGRARAGAADVLNGALSSERSGEVIVSALEESARIHVEQGRVVWVHRPLHPVSVKQLLDRAGAGLDDQAVKDLLDESRETRRHFADVVVSWGIVAPESLREALRRHLQEELAVIMAWHDASATFVADNRARRSELSFSSEELALRPKRPPRVSTIQNLPAVKQPAPDRRSVDDWLDRICAIEHVAGCAIVDPKLGRVVGGRGFVPSDMTLLWEMARAFTAMGELADEILATAHDRAFLVRAVPALGGLVFIVRFDAVRLSPAMARIVVSRVVLGRADGPEPGRA